MSSEIVATVSDSADGKKLLLTSKHHCIYHRSVLTYAIHWEHQNVYKTYFAKSELPLLSNWTIVLNIYIQRMPWLGHCATCAITVVSRHFLVHNFSSTTDCKRSGNSSSNSGPAWNGAMRPWQPFDPAVEVRLLILYILRDYWTPGESVARGWACAWELTLQGEGCQLHRGVEWTLQPALKRESGR